MPPVLKKLQDAVTELIDDSSPTTKGKNRKKFFKREAMLKTRTTSQDNLSLLGLELNSKNKSEDVSARHMKNTRK